MSRIYGALEAGGTKMVCGVADEEGHIADSISIPTREPANTVPDIIAYFKEKNIDALGIGCFGPVCLDRNSPKYGHILDTPKLAWRGYDILGAFRKEIGVPVGLDTDVNGALLGEVTFGDARGLTDAVYITIGTGIGAGILSGGRLIHGMQHPEAGHIRLAPINGDTYKGKCPYHGTCFEGLAAGPAIEERWGAPAKELADRPEVWELEAGYIARAITDYIMILSPQRIILGGGVMHQEQLFPLIRKKVLEDIAGYIRTEQLDNIDSYIVPASLNDRQGLLGAVKLAIDAEEAAS